MIKRTLVIAALGAALLGAIAGISHVRSALAAHTNAPTPDLTLRAVSPPAADDDATAPCTNQGQPNESGNCPDSENQTGPEDNTGEAEKSGAAETPDPGEISGGSDGDKVQSGP